MNRRERAVVMLLAATLLAGIGISQYKRATLAHSSLSIRASSLLSSAPSGSSSFPPSPLPLDLNQATLRQLDVLPGIGPVLASRILEYRRRNGGFRRVSELKAVSGIGPKRYAALKDMVTVGTSVAGAAADSGR